MKGFGSFRGLTGDLVNRFAQWWAKEPKRMARWDRFVLIVILSSAIEVPYSAMVAEQDDHTVLIAISWIFFIVYSADIAVSLTVRDNDEIGRSETLQAIWERLPHRWNDAVPQRAKAYLASWSFVIDLVATIPWVVLSSSLGVLPAARLARLTVIARALKLWKAPSMWRGAFRANPALGRFISIISIGAYLWFVHACLLFWAERSNPETKVTFGRSLNSIFVTFTSNDLASTLTPIGRLVSISAVVVSVTLIAAIFGNFTSFFTNRDQLELAHIERHANWNVIFELYPTVFDAEISDEIRGYVDSLRGSNHLQGEHLKMIDSLPNDLEVAVKEAIAEAELPGSAEEARRLQEFQQAISTT